jgi:flagellar M-ring protein FliF
MQKLQNLVAAAVGIDPARGDQITVENIAFDVPPVEVVPVATPWQRVQEHGGPILRTVALVVIVGMILLVFVRPMVSRALALPSGEQEAAVSMRQQLPRTIADIEGDIEAQLDAETADRMDRRHPVLARRVMGMAAGEPAAAAKLVRSWLADGRN